MNTLFSRHQLNLIIILAIIASMIPTLIAFTGFNIWPFSILGNFVIQGLGVSICLAIYTLVKRLYVLTIAAIVISLSAYGVIATQPVLPSALPDEQSAIEFRIAHINLFGRDEAMEALIDWTASTKPDVIAITELPRGAPESPLLSRLFKSYPFRTFSYNGGPARVLIISRFPIVDHQTGSGLIARAIIKLPDGTPITIFSMHPAPPFTPFQSYQRDNVIKRAFTFAHQQKGPSIVLGDFNATPWLKTMKQHARNTGLARAEPNRFATSWLSRIPLFGLPIDHIYTTAHFRRIDITTGPGLGSDHFPLLAVLALDTATITQDFSKE